jgi:hypothetical protein
MPNWEALQIKSHQKMAKFLLQKAAYKIKILTLLFVIKKASPK